MTTDEETVETECEEKFTDLFDRLVKKGYPLLLVCRAFVTSSMICSRHYMVKNDPARVPGLLRRFAVMVEKKLNIQGS